MVALLRALYSALGTLLAPLLTLLYRERAKIGKEDPFRLSERAGLATLTRPNGTLVWFHAASVGEAQSVLTLIRALLAAAPALHVLITTGTVTSAALVARQNIAHLHHQFVPMDTPAAVRRFLDHWQPNLALWVESEFWPQLMWQTQARRIPMLLINARISEKTFRNWKRAGGLIRSLLNGFTAIYAGSDLDAERLRALGAHNIHSIGNLKYDAPPLPVDTKLAEELAKQTAGRPILVVASTHAPEEISIAQTHLLAATRIPNLLTILVPRHANRGNGIATDLRAHGIALAQRSKGETITPETQLYLADTMGELGTFYAAADLVFMGGSLIPHGGQNPLEAARFTKPILSGPHTQNFAAIIAQFQATSAIEVVADAETLANAIVRQMGDPAARQRMAQYAHDLVEQHRGASTHILQHSIALLAGEAP